MVSILSLAWSVKTEELAAFALLPMEFSRALIPNVVGSLFPVGMGGSKPDNSALRGEVLS
jgi:hypothetical protein